VRREVVVTLDAAPEAVREAARRELGVRPGGDDTSPTALVGTLDGLIEPGPVLRVEVSAQHSDGPTTVLLGVETDYRVPWFQWFIGPAVGRRLRVGLDHAGKRLAARLAGGPAPRPPRRSPLLPPVPFPAPVATLLATVAAVSTLTNFGGALFGQTAGSVADAFGASNQELGVALAISRAGVLVALVATALADRRGRRVLALACLAGVCLANAVSAVAPAFAVFTGAQVFTRAFATSALVVTGIAAIEEAPDGARAYSLAMLSLASGAGFALSVALLPLADLGRHGWRLAFGVSALSILLLPALARNLVETRRYSALSERQARRGRVREIFDSTYGRRFVLLSLAAFLSNILSAPSAQLTNRFLEDAHGYSNSSIAVFRGVTNGLPGLFGIILAGRIAESRGRKPAGIVALIAASGLQVAFFLGSGTSLWITSTLGIVAAACAGIALGSLDAELFATEVRGTSNAGLLVAGVLGSVAGLLLATNLDGALGGLGPAIALCALGPLLAAVFVVPFLPEPADRPLDDISPSEV